MLIKARLPLVKEVAVEVKEEEKIGDLKRKVCGELGIPEEFTRLLLDGKPLPEGSRIKDFELGSKPVTVDYLWARHIPLWGSEAQEALRASSVLLVGAGALGNEVAKNLAMLGVGKLAIVDHDRVELSNLSRSVFFEEGDVGEPKALILGRRLKAKYPHLDVEAYVGRVEDLPLSAFLRSDAMVSGVDNLAARVFLATVSSRYGIPLVDGGMDGARGRVQVFLPPDWPCPACVIPPGEYGRLVGLRNPCSAPNDQGTVPSLPTVISLVSSIQAQETAKILMSKVKKEAGWPPLKGILLIDVNFNRYTVLEAKKNPNCIVCGKDGLGKDKVERLEISAEECRDSISELIKLASAKANVQEPHEVLAFVEEGGRTVKLPGYGRLSARGLKPGAAVRLIFKKLKQEDYKEAVAKLI